MTTETQAPSLAELRAAYCTALETLWAASKANTLAWEAQRNGEPLADAAWDAAAEAETVAQTNERDAFDAYRRAWRTQNGWC